MIVVNVKFTPGAPHECPTGTHPKAPDGVCQGCEYLQKCRQSLLAKEVDMNVIAKQVQQNSIGGLQWDRSGFYS